jgi:hypothetical protein
MGPGGTSRELAPTTKRRVDLSLHIDEITRPGRGQTRHHETANQ